MERRVGIIGAGVSGLLACKYTLEKGFHPIVFEAQPSIGGVWTHTIETTKLQSPRDAYQFSDFPWPSSVKEEFPNNSQVMEHLESYASHFDLYRYIKFNSRVPRIEYMCASDEEMSSWDLWGGNGEAFSPGGKWNITVEDRSRSTEVNLFIVVHRYSRVEQSRLQIYQVEFMILCLGHFSGVPNIPTFAPNQGPEVFDGKVLHAMDYAAMDSVTAAEFIKGKRVTVVGIQKSGLDIAAECAMANGVEHPCTLIFRNEHWTTPSYYPWGVPLPLLYFNRFSELMFHKPGEGFLLSLLATLLSTLRWMSSKFVESYVRWKLPLKKYKMIPKRSFHEDVSSCTIAITPDGFYDRVEEGRIVLKKSSSFSFNKKGLMMDDNNILETDVVIFATGYKGDDKIRNIFASPTLQKHIMGSSMTTVPLYRECIHPQIPQLSVIGYSESYINIYTSEMRCEWLVHLLDGNFKLPSVKEMQEDVLRWEKYMKRYTSNYHRRSCIGVLHIWYNDQLCKDMKCNPTRKKGFVRELFEPYGPMDFTNLSTNA